MSRWLADKKISTLILITIVGFIIGSYLSLLIGMIPGESNVVKELFMFKFIPLSIGYYDSATGNSIPICVDINAISFQFGFQLNINAMSIIGAAVALWIYREYR